MKRKKLPDFVSNPLLVRLFQSKPGRVLSNWVLQGMLYMNPIEIIYKLLLDLVLTVLFIFIFFQDPGIGDVIVALLLAHTTNWIINCQPVALLMHIDIGKNDPHRFIQYIEGLERRIQGRPYLAAAASYGSLSKGCYRETSDIDIRFVLKDNILQRFQAAHYCFLERFRALIHWFPLDLYAFSLEETLRKMNADEVPVIFVDPEGIIERNYARTVPFGEFRKTFRANILGETIS
ncbi:hypothetical protein DFR30_2787 [Thiogranum longum]|uniref:Uncharacterized protein n=1 Tax=Thiogranum longum TaxID=1537524 RepID=A0A4V2PH66_9GAMM|nr:hypothetical protein [Thiogranum longum]TCK19476.1 hypothetical protein DFR30_2787 [Thiogranum longum]